MLLVLFERVRRFLLMNTQKLFENNYLVMVHGRDVEFVLLAIHWNSLLKNAAMATQKQYGSIRVARCVL